MDDTRGASPGLYKRLKSSSTKKYIAFTLIAFVLLFVFSGGFGLVNLFNKGNYYKGNVCGDGTLYNTCSPVKPYFCLAGKFVERASKCGCPEGFRSKGDMCISSYQTGGKKITLKYTLRGEDKIMNFVVYSGFEDYISKVPRSIYYSDEKDYSRADFILKAINEEEQRKLLLPLVIEIQNITKSREDQARIAISLVQNIPFGASNKTSNFGSMKVDYSRYPYEVLYDMSGICGEKTDLLIFLLREIGYGTAFFYYPHYNHEAAGISCPSKESLLDSGYCFVETTGPAIISDNKISYVGVGKLLESPEIYPISEGISLGQNIYEYSDANQLIRITESIEKSGWIGPLNRKVLEKLTKKYGLIEEYYSS